MESWFEDFFSFLQSSYSQGLGGHWESIRPGLLNNIFGTRVHLAKGSPICVLTATITHSELAIVSGMFGRKREPSPSSPTSSPSFSKKCSEFGCVFSTDEPCKDRLILTAILSNFGAFFWKCWWWWWWWWWCCMGLQKKFQGQVKVSRVNKI